MRVAIPTKNRPNNQRTLKLLYKSFKKDELFLFVEPQEIEDYRKYEKIATLVELKENDKGIAYVRNSIIEYFKKGIVFMLDDDINGIYERFGYSNKGYQKLKKIAPKNLRAYFVRMEYEMIKNGYAQATISFQPSNWLYEDNKKETTRVWCFNILDLNKIKNIRYDSQTDLFEDYDISINILSKGLKNCSFYYWAFSCEKMGSNKGGCQTIRNKTNILKSIDIMRKKWGNDIIKTFFSEEHNLPEIKINWKKIWVKK